MGNPPSVAGEIRYTDKTQFQDGTAHWETLIYNDDTNWGHGILVIKLGKVTIEVAVELPVMPWAKV